MFWPKPPRPIQPPGMHPYLMYLCLVCSITAPPRLCSSPTLTRGNTSCCRWKCSTETSKTSASSTQTESKLSQSHPKRNKAWKMPTVSLQHHIIIILFLKKETEWLLLDLPTPGQKQQYSISYPFFVLTQFLVMLCSWLCFAYFSLCGQRNQSCLV